MSLAHNTGSVSRADVQVQHPDPGWCDDCGAPLDIFDHCCVCHEPDGHEGSEQ